ncbi:2 [[Clostridium] sordellii]|uniref:Tripartite ATP-independent periplasmictransporter, DctQ family n=1 Tax=Paraclostridium sordellii TaxID=1505 RepID=A0ABP1XR80_PARSO|nr:TRAP transporter small permease [Paeniclostridium sordellii]EPZ54215.1 tripartite ATP-independent periplasmic transporter, DctQ family [[Clostridium] sordellii ATCC 9714] [Paeniclostridium sordellii ATCC 9714]TAN65192.1 TRAP transporter small permease [Paeniclostridium sordellii 8483]CEJ73698.1 tripartite ATP-independent periplasmictransporter, DctQ family [[Clostridium] sordellii] [Paeniclostridium sordellii]CEK29942.1 2 [[Clostridium] sordellii] [Paeniclostridium sordellii]CEN69246.1 2 [[
MNKFRNILNKVIEVICITLLAFMVVLGTWQIITRYILNNPSTVSEDLLIYSFVWMSLLGSAYVFGKKDHMTMVFFRQKLESKSPKVKIILNVITELLVMIFSSFVLVLGGFQISMLAMGQISPALGISMGYIYLSLPLSGVITIIYNILNLMDLKQEIAQSNKKNVNVM